MKQPRESRIFKKNDGRVEDVRCCRVAVIGYGNQGRAQALNLRDSGLQVIVGNRGDAYRRRAQADGFPVLNIAEATAKADICLLLIPDEELSTVYENTVRSALSAGGMLVFASGYGIGFGEIEAPTHVDVALLAPRMIGVGVREKFLTGEGFYCLVGIHHDASGEAWKRLLGLTVGISGLYKPAIEVSFHQEAVLDLFNEQAFGPAFGRVLLTSIKVLLDAGLPPEAVLVEMYMSEEMSYIYQQMSRVGLIRQTDYHSQTSQYGAMSRAVRFLDPKLRKIMEGIFREIDSGRFAREWRQPLSRLKLKGLRWFATRQKLNTIEQKVRQRLGVPEIALPASEEDELPDRNILDNPEIRKELEGFQKSLEF
jgi:ketol-acid reductoisomerase